MVTRAQFDAYARRKMRIDKAIERAIDELWDSLDKTSMETLALDLALYLPLVAEQYGKACAVVAADFYDDMRRAARVGGSYKATTAHGATWKVERDVKYAFGADFAYENQKAFLTESVKQVARDFGHETIKANSDRDSFCDGYVSVPTDDEPCVFCAMKTLDSYRRYRGERLETEVSQDAWHDGCRCELLPMWKDTPNWVDTDLDRYETMYREGRKAAEAEARENGTWNGKLSVAQVQRGMRQASGLPH
jgi:hypothetical protein